MFMSFIFKYTLFSLQGHICLLQGHKVCTRTRYFNACVKRHLCTKHTLGCIAFIAIFNRGVDASQASLVKGLIRIVTQFGFM